MSVGFYEKIVELGIEHDHHESDLYVPVNAQTRALVEAYPYRSNVKAFVSQIDKKPWYDVPFAYTPFWDKARRRIEQRKS
jgi:hypothetical protein